MSIAPSIITTVKNPLLQQAESNLLNYIECIRCIYETFIYSETTLYNQLVDVEKQYSDFIKCRTKINEDGKNVLTIKSIDVRKYKSLSSRYSRAQYAFEIIPPSYLVSLVSAYDSFVAGLVRCVYSVCPDKLKECERTFQYKDLTNFQSISDIKDALIAKQVETLLRDSHTKQMDWFAKAFGVQTLKDFEDWGIFVEVTERRNLFVHSSGIVSQQYISECSSNNALVRGIELGSQLNVDRKYFTTAYHTLYEVGIMLTQMMMRRLCVSKEASLSGEVDESLISNSFELIMQENYDVAIKICNFALAKQFSHTARNKKYIILNLAQAYKWNGNNEKCQEILTKEDWSADQNELKVPLLVLQEKYVEAFELIRTIGNSSGILNYACYNDWPIFKDLRKHDNYLKIMTEVFGEKVVEQDSEIIQEQNSDAITESKSKEEEKNEIKTIELSEVQLN